MTYYHYTCDHGRRSIGDAGNLRPHGTGDMPVVVWMTDLAVPDIVGLGLTSEILTCERWTYRYRITDERSVVPYTEIQHLIHPQVQLGLHHAGSLPDHWFVSFRPIAAVFDPPTLVTSEALMFAEKAGIPWPEERPYEQTLSDGDGDLG